MGETIDGGVADSDVIRLGIGQTGEQTIACRPKVIVHLEGPGVDVDSHDLAAIAGLDERANLPLVDLIPSAGVFFFGIPGLAGSMALSPLLAGQGLRQVYPTPG